MTQTKLPRVLLFAVDVLVGNWLHRQKLEWPQDGSSSGKVIGADLVTTPTTEVMGRLP